MANISQIKLPSGTTYDIKDSGALQLTGGQVTGPVTFNDSVSMDDATVGGLIVNGNASFTNNIQVNTINGVAVGNTPKFTDTNTDISTLTLATDSGTSSITLAHGSKYKLTAGTKSIIFTMPTDNNSGGTVTSVRVQATSPIQSSTSTAQTTTLNTTISLADAYGDTKNPYGSKTAGYVLAAPQNAAGAPSFRQLSSVDIKPLLTKTYDAYTISASDSNNGIIFFGTVSIDDTSQYYTPWAVHYRLTVTTTENVTRGMYDCWMFVNGSTVNYKVFNDFYSTDYRPIYHHGMLYPKNSYSSEGAHLGVRIYSARSDTSLARTIKVEVLETIGCSVTLKDSLTKYSALYNSTKFYYGEYSGTSPGLQETGDADNGQYYLRYYTLKAESAITAGNIIVGTNNGYKHLKLGTDFDIKYPILYAGSNISAGGTSSNNYIFHYAFGIGTTQSITLTSYLPVYIKGTISGTTFTPVSTAPLTQTISASDDGYVYYYIGRAYSTTAITFDATAQAVYCYKNDAIRIWEADPIFTASAAYSITSTDINSWKNANSLQWNNSSKELRVSKNGSMTTVFSKSDLDIPTVPSSTGSNTTGISIAAHGTGTIIGVQTSTASVRGVKTGDNSTTTASKVTVGSHSTDYGVKSAGSGSFTSGTFNGGSGSASLTFTMDTTDTRKLKIAFSHTHTAATHGADSHTHTAPTLGSKVPTISASDVTVPIRADADTTVPIKNASASTFVTGTSHTVTDNGHTHTI